MFENSTNFTYKVWYIIRKNFPCTIYCNLYFLDELFWIFGSKVLQKHLFSASGVLKKAQNRHKLKVFNPLHILGCFFWRLMMMLCCPSLCLSWTYGFQSKSTPKTPFCASEGLKRTHNRHKFCNLRNAFFGWLCPSKAYIHDEPLVFSPGAPI